MGYYQGKVRKLKEELEAYFVGNRGAIDILVLNQLHVRSSTLIRAGKGMGKSTLMLLLFKGLGGDDFVVISGASEVKRGEILGRLHIPSLEREGVEKVSWASFVKAPCKGLDEVNRLNPYCSANIYHLMQFGEAWAYSQRTVVGDYTLIATENPADPTAFIHPPPFYDRFDVCIFLSSLTLSEKFQLQSLLDRCGGSIVDSMPQVMTFNELSEARREVSEVELDSELIGTINILVRDFQACIRDREHSEVKPPVLCEGCHFQKDVCSRVKEPLSERAVVVLGSLAKAKVWLDGKCGVEDILSLALWTLPHRVVLTRVRNVLSDLKEILRVERGKMSDRYARRQWSIMNSLYRRFDLELYERSKEIAMEDLVFAEELRKAEEVWIREGKLKPEESLDMTLARYVY